MDIANVIQFKHPKAKFGCGETYDSLNWVDQGIPKPSLQDLESWEVDYKKYVQDNQYKGERRVAYQLEKILIPEMVVALWERIIENNPKASDDMQVIREAIKQKIPKPKS